MIRSLFLWIDALPSSIAIRESDYGYAILLTTHLVTIVWFAGLILMMDLRLLGWGNTKSPVSQIQGRLFSWQMGSMTASAVTGLLLVYAQPLRYYPKIFFWLKMLLIVAAGVNALIFHFTTYKSVDRWDNDRVPPAGARRAGAIGLVLWAAVIVLGRLTAYNWIDAWWPWPIQ
ncbi:MAG: hypothetical protein AB7N65_21380 [Vicinamibacterales bacterium]